MDPNPQPWRCKTCWRLIKAKQQYCPSCGGWWGDVNDTTYQKRPSQVQQDWQWNEWEETTPRQRNARKRSNSTRSKGRGKGKSKDKGKEKPTEGSQPSPFATMPLPEVPAGPFAPTNLHLALPEPAASGSNELLSAIRRAFPDTQSMPTEIKEALERSEGQVSKQLTSELHRATSSMGKAQRTLKELMDAKERHRLQWLQHLGESLKSWRLQLDSYDAKQSEFADSITKARKDMEASHVMIQTLNARAAGKPVPAHLETSVPADTAEDLSHIQDPEERALRKSLHGLLAECATKMEVKEEETKTKDNKSELVMSSGDEGAAGEKGPQKRQRSKSPGNGKEPDAGSFSLQQQSALKDAASTAAAALLAPKDAAMTTS